MNTYSIETSIPSGRVSICKDEDYAIILSGPRQESARTEFCNYLLSEVENLEERNFQTFGNETVKLLIVIQDRAEERNLQPQKPTFSRRTSSTSTYVTQTYRQQSQQPLPWLFQKKTDASKSGHTTIQQVISINTLPLLQSPLFFRTKNFAGTRKHFDFFKRHGNF